MQTKEKRSPERIASDVIKAGGGKVISKFGGGYLTSMKDLLETGVMIRNGSSVPNLVSGTAILKLLAEEGLTALDLAARASFGETAFRDPFDAGITFARISEPRREVLGSDPRDYGV